jgi:hypothetical protein
MKQKQITDIKLYCSSCRIESDWRKVKIQDTKKIYNAYQCRGCGSLGDKELTDILIKQ